MGFLTWKICAWRAGGEWSRSAYIDASGGVCVRQEFARRLLCNRQRSRVEANCPCSTFALLWGTGMPFRVREVRPAKPQAASFTEALAGLIAWLVHARYAVADLFLSFYACRTHRVLQITEDDSRGRGTSASGFHDSHFIDAAARNIHPAIGSCCHIPHCPAAGGDARSRKAFRFRIEPDDGVGLHPRLAVPNHSVGRNRDAIRSSLRPAMRRLHLYRP